MVYKAAALPGGMEDFLLLQQGEIGDHNGPWWPQNL